MKGVKCFSYPLTFETLMEFCHPVPHHHYHHPAMIDGKACATNGFVAIMAHGGLWLSDDFCETKSEFQTNFAKIPFGRFPNSCDWFRLENHFPALFRRGELARFGKDHRLAPSPSVLVGRVNVLVSMLQLASRLPAAEVSIADTGAPALYFRCSGAKGVIAAVRGDMDPAFTIDPVQRGHDGHARPISSMGALPLRGWPPVDNTPN